MTTKDYIKKLDQRIKEVSFANKNIYLIVADAHVDYVDRIYTHGKRADGSKIGNYKNGSYKKKRDKTGRQTRFVDLRYRGTEEIDVRNSLQKVSNFKIINGARNTSNADKIGWHIEQYGKDVFELGATIEKEMTERLAEVLVKIIAG